MPATKKKSKKANVAQPPPAVNKNKSSVPSVPSVAADDQKPPRQYTPNPVVTEIPIACPRCKSTKSKKPQPVFSTEQLADARQRAHIAIPDGPELLIIQEADDVYACWWISPLDEAESRLPKSEYPDAEDVADALEDVQYYATQHGHGIIHPNVCEE